MAKPRLPKKSNDLKETVPSTSNPLPLSEANAGPAAPSSSVAVAETRPTETRETKKTTRKPEIVRTEPRANLVPINLDDEIRRLAYLLAERRGFAPGHEAEDWLTAEHEVRQRYHQHSA